MLNLFPKLNLVLTEGDTCKLLSLSFVSAGESFDFPAIPEVTERASPMTTRRPDLPEQLSKFSESLDLNDIFRSNIVLR